MTSIAVVFAIGLAVGRVRRSCGYLIATSSSRNEAALPSIGVARTFFVASSLGAVSLSPGGDGGSPPKHRDHSALTRSTILASLPYFAVAAAFAYFLYPAIH
jgi:hypothetical protein